MENSKRRYQPIKLHRRRYSQTWTKLRENKFLAARRLGCTEKDALSEAGIDLAVFKRQLKRWPELQEMSDKAVSYHFRGLQKYLTGLLFQTKNPKIIIDYLKSRSHEGYVEKSVVEVLDHRQERKRIWQSDPEVQEILGEIVERKRPKIKDKNQNKDKENGNSTK